jgi:hypothetical protein
MKMVGKADGWTFVISDGGVSYRKDGDESATFASMGMDGAAVAMMYWIDGLREPT